MMGNRLNPAGKLAARQQHPSTAAQAFQPDVCAQPDDFPFITPAWVWLTQAKDILQP
jgi:hypothetical protein